MFIRRENKPPVAALQFDLHPPQTNLKWFQSCPPDVPLCFDGRRNQFLLVYLEIGRGSSPVISLTTVSKPPWPPPPPRLNWNYGSEWA